MESIRIVGKFWDELKYVSGRKVVTPIGRNTMTVDGGKYIAELVLVGCMAEGGLKKYVVGTGMPSWDGVPYEPTGDEVYPDSFVSVVVNKTPDLMGYCDVDGNYLEPQVVTNRLIIKTTLGYAEYNGNVLRCQGLLFGGETPTGLFNFMSHAKIEKTADMMITRWIMLEFLPNVES